MAGPVVTTLLSPNPAKGTWAPSDNVTETALASSTSAAGTYALRLDMGASGGWADGDIIQMSVYTYAGGTTERIARRYSIVGGGPAGGASDPKIYVSEPFPTADDYKVTLLLVAGGVSSRSFPWDVINLNGTQMGVGSPIQCVARNEILGLGTSSATGIPVTGGTANAYGSLATIGTTGFAYDGFYLTLQGGGNIRCRFVVTAKVGSGGDETIVQDVTPTGQMGSTGINSIWCPIHVPSGAVLKVKSATIAVSQACNVSILGYAGDATLTQGYSRIVSLTDFGTSTSFCDPASTVTFSGTTTTAWSQLQASTPAAVDAIGCAINSLGNAQTATYNRTDITWGASGSESATPLVRLMFRMNTTIGFGFYPFIPCSIPAGTRLAYRGTASTTNTSVYGICVWGFAR